MKGFFILLFALLMVALGRLCCGAKEDLSSAPLSVPTHTANFG